MEHFINLVRKDKKKKSYYNSSCFVKIKLIQNNKIFFFVDENGKENKTKQNQFFSTFFSLLHRINENCNSQFNLLQF